MAVIFVAASLQTHAQGTFVYDQQSATNPYSIHTPFTDGLYIQEDSPLMQSFDPTLSAIGFVQFEFEDVPNNGTNGATVYVNIWTGSPNTNSATLLGSTTPVYMPDGFINGFYYTGVTNFYFSTPVTLTPGQTYYLQPVVLSGDDPWAIMTIGDTYSYGQLFEKGLGFSTDMWFREGMVVPVPEPTALALIGLSGLLACAFKRRSKLFIVLGAGTLLFGSVQAQTISLQSTPDTVVEAAADAAGLTPVSATALPRTGTFWVMMPGPNGNLTALPYPSLPASLSASPIYSVTASTFLVDASGGQVFSSSSGARMSRAQVASAVQAQASTVAGLIATMQADGLSPGSGSGTNSGAEFYSDSFNYQVPTNGLWPEIEDEGTNVLVILHNTSDDQFYQLNSTTNLSNTNWDVGSLQSGEWESDQTWFWPIAKLAPVTFYRAHNAEAIMQVWDVQDSVEPDPTNNDPGQAGIIGIQNGDGVHTATNDITVYYTLGGTARNGIDYSNLPGALTLAAGMKDTNIIIQPTAMGLKSDQTIVLTLLQNSNYLIDPDYVFTTNTLFANSPFYPVVNGDIESPCPNTPWPIDLASDASDPRNLPLTYSILTWPTHGTLTTNTLPAYVIYTPTNCYEGQDSFTFTASDGQFTSAPAAVTLIISDSISASPVSAQTCRGTPVGITLSGGDACGETLSYAPLSNPLHGTVISASGQATDPGYVYTPSANFTGTDSFNYRVTDECGDSATNTVTITVGDANVYPNPQSVMTGTNQPVAITLSASDFDYCVEAGNYTYTIVSGPAHGTPGGTPPNVTYTPNTNYEGADFFQFTVSDGVWTSSPATNQIYVVAGPILMTGCNPFKTGPSVELDWSLDNTVQQMEQQYRFISDYKIYRSAVSGSNYACIYTNTDISQMSYSDTNAVAGQTNYYVVTFEFTDNGSGKTYESPRSNEIVVTGRNPNNLIAPDAIWAVWDVTPNQPQAWLGYLRAPFGLPFTYATDHPTWPPLIPITATNSANWSDCNVWSNQLTLNLPNYTGQQLSNVVYSIAIDNDYQLYVNSRLIDQTNYNHGNGAVWSAFKPLNAFTNLVAGTNNITVVIWGDCDRVGYFSMLVTTNICGQ